MIDWEWSHWIAHCNTRWPRGVEPDEVVQCVMSNGDMLSPMAASGIGWVNEGDAVVRYRRRVYKAPVRYVQRSETV